MTFAAVYVFFLLYAVLRLFRRPSETEANYIVAGRRLTLPAFVATMVSSWYGGILGVGEYAWTYGVSNWLVFGAPYYLYAVAFAVLLARRARQSRVLTLPELLHDRYGRTPALLGAATIFVMTVPAAYVLMLGVLVEMATGWPLWLGVTLGAALSLGYVLRGGLRAIVGTDKLQFALMFLGFVVLVPVCAAKYGGWDYLRGALPASHLTWSGGRGFQAVAVWYVIAASTLVEPAFYQRCYAARDGRTARRGLFVSVGFWILFDFLTTTAGLYARAVLPALERPMAAFPLLAAEVLPPVWRGLFVTGLLATIMSTVDTNAFVAAVTGGRDIWSKLRGRPGDEAASLRASRRALPVVGALSVGLALWSGSVIELWHHLGSVGTPVLLLPVLLAHGRRRRSGRRVALSMCVSAVVSLSWLALGGGGPWLGVESIFPGLAASAAVMLTEKGAAPAGTAP
ncbi:sodium:solute symporter family protein [bacterium]|nr:sodium:solute symporter family protein [bacterium]MBU1674230.1 sodium:solute symporter family protein [bacterium]